MHPHPHHDHHQAPEGRPADRPGSESRDFTDRRRPERGRRFERTTLMTDPNEPTEFGPEFGRRGRGRDRDRGRPDFQPPRGRGHRGGFPGGPPRPQRARRGDIRSAILSLLGQEPQNGYALMKSFAAATDGAWRPSPGSIYPTLTQLVEEGLIIATGEGRSTKFELTDEGRAHIVEHAADLDKAWASATGQSEEDLEFHASVAKLNGVIEQFRYAASDEQRLAGQKAIDDARRALYLILAD